MFLISKVFTFLWILYLKKEADSPLRSYVCIYIKSIKNKTGRKFCGYYLRPVFNLSAYGL